MDLMEEAALTAFKGENIQYIMFFKSSTFLSPL